MTREEVEKECLVAEPSMRKLFVDFALACCAKQAENPAKNDAAWEVVARELIESGREIARLEATIENQRRLIRELNKRIEEHVRDPHLELNRWIELYKK